MTKKEQQAIAMRNRKIVRAILNGATAKQAAMDFGISRPMVHKILDRFKRFCVSVSFGSLAAKDIRRMRDNKREYFPLIKNCFE